MSEARVLPAEGVSFEAEAPVLIVGAGAAGLVAALAAREAGAEVLLLERDALPRGSTALSAGLIPAAGTRWQAAAGVADDPERFAADILAKAHGEPDPGLVAMVARAAGPALEWLADRHGLPVSLVEGFRYPGHSADRMHALPTRSGLEFVDALRAAAEEAGADLLTDARVTTLFVNENGRVRGVEATRPGGGRERIGAGAVVLACNGYGGAPDLVRAHVPELSDALYFGHPGNTGEALRWGEALALRTRHLPGHQGHGSVAHPHGILLTWATMAEGGCQVNAHGHRFHNEGRGYSEAAAEVLRQPGGVAWSVFDARIAAICRQFEDFRALEAAGAPLAAEDWEALAARMGVDGAALAATMRAFELAKRGHGAGGAVAEGGGVVGGRAAGGQTESNHAKGGASGAAGGRATDGVAATQGVTEGDPLGRALAGLPPLVPPFHAVRVTGALFHTQGGLVVDGEARTLREDGTPAPNLFAAGGAAAGVSGDRASGYLSGNGLLTAVALGRLAGAAAARLAV